MTRGSYRITRAADLEAIEARRIAGGFTVGQLASKAGMDRSTYQRMRRTGQGFMRRIKSLQMALRTLESEAKRIDEAFPIDEARP